MFAENRPLRLAVLLSGRGSNFLSIHEAILDGRLDAKIVAVVSNRPEAPGLERASELGYRTHSLDHKLFPSRAEHEAEVIRVLQAAEPDVIVLAGYMRLLSAAFVSTFAGRIVNIHPSLLPAFPGVDAQRQAIEHGVKVTGCTVHFVDEGLDTGPIILQKTLDVRDDDTPVTLAERLLPLEHAGYVEALHRIRGGLRLEGRRVVAG